MKVLTVGGAMIDTIAVIANERIERMSMRNADTDFLLLEEGRKVEAEEVSTHCGGGAVNTAVCLARLGHDVAALIKLGQDARAETILSHLAEEGVSTRYAVRDRRAPTGASVLVSAHDRNAAIFTFRGANTLLEPGDLKRDAFAVQLVYISNLSNQSADCFPEIVTKSKAEGALVATNPGVRQLSARQGDFLAHIDKLDILAVNKVEAGVLIPYLVGKFGEHGPQLPSDVNAPLPELALRGFTGGGFDMSFIAFFRAMHELGPRYILVSDGKHGAFLATPGQIVHWPAVPVKVMGTAGAGDAAASTLSAFIADGASAEEALLAAVVNSSSVVEHIDTQTGLLKREGLLQRMQEARKFISCRTWSL